MSNTGIERTILRLAALGLLSILLADCSPPGESRAALRSVLGGSAWTSVAVRTVELREPWAVQSLAFSPDDADLAVTSPFSGEVHVWTLKAGARLVRILNQLRGGNLNGLRYSPDGSLLASAHQGDEKDRIIRIWKTGTGAVAGAVAGDIAEHIGGSGALEYAGIDFSPDGRLLLRSESGWTMNGQTEVFADGFVVHSTNTWSRVWSLHTEPLMPSTFGLSPDGRYAAIAGTARVMRQEIPRLENRLLIVDLTTHLIVRSVAVMQDNFLIAFVTWSPDARWIAIGGTAIAVDKGSRFTGGAVQILDARTGTQVAERSYPTTNRNGEVLALQYSSDGRYLIIAQINALEIWDAGMTHLLQQVRGEISAARLSPDGKKLAVATLDGRVSIWRLR